MQYGIHAPPRGPDAPLWTLSGAADSVSRVSHEADSLPSSGPATGADVPGADVSAPAVPDDAGGAEGANGVAATGGSGAEAVAAEAGPPEGTAIRPDAPPSPSRVEGDELVLTFPDPGHHLSAVRLWAHLTTPLERDFARVPGGWELRQPIPDLDRLEYMVEITGADDHEQLGLDPGNDRRVGGAFGDHSWLPMPGYREPAWLGAPGDAHHVEEWGIVDGPDGELRARVWSPAATGPGDVLPMLIAHDGPESDALGGLTRCVDALVTAGRLPRVRVVLLEPGPERSARYSARDEYAAALAEATRVLTSRWPTPTPPALFGASLGALAALHAEWTHPGTYSALFLASGSYFTPATDPGELEFEHWDAVTAFTRRVQESDAAPSRPAITLVCGTAEENIVNNLAMRDHLTRLGLEPGWGTVRDGHCYTAWRDLLDPHLPDLLARAWA